jgi:hypothetical protein
MHNLSESIKKPKLALVLTQRQQVRAWTLAQNISTLNEAFFVTIFAPKTCKDELVMYLKNAVNIEYFSIPRSDNLDRLILYELLLEHKEWPSFRKRLFMHVIDEVIEKSKLRLYFKLLTGLFKKRFFFLMLLSHHIRKIQARDVNQSIQKSLFDLNDYDAILLVSNVTDLTNEIAVQSAIHAGKPWIQVVDNWDNLSSKLCPSKMSSALVVWGEQSKKFALEIHDVPLGKIFVLGSSRLPNIHKIQELSNEFRRDKKVLNDNLSIFYPGFGGEIETYEWINDLYNEISNVFQHQKIHISFRPHPLSLIRNGVEYYGNWPRHINIDLPKVSSRANSDWPALDDDIYSTMLKTDVVIGTPSTFLLEALMFNMPVVLDFRNHLPTYNSSQKNFQIASHFKDIVSDRSILRFYSSADAAEAIHEELSNMINRQELVGHLLFNTDDPFMTRLVPLIRQISFLKS